MDDTDSDLREAILGEIHRHHRRITPGEMEKILAGSLSLSRSLIRRVIRALVSENILTYTQHFGHTFLEVSFNRPVRVSSRVVLSPPGTRETFPPGTVGVFLDPGAAFGGGDHPTTRLSVQGMDRYMATYPERIWERALDIGTGTGVLTVAAIRLGFREALGLDIDPCALAEARANAALNSLSHRIRISDTDITEIPGVFDLILANLRPPTLASMAASMSRLLHPAGALVVSGFRPEEAEGVLSTMRGFTVFWKGEERGWAGMVLVPVSPGS